MGRALVVAIALLCSGPGAARAPADAASAAQPASARQLAALHDVLLADLSEQDLELRAHRNLGMPLLRPDTAETLADEAARATALRARLAAIDTQALSAEDQLTHAYLDRLLASLQARPGQWLHSFPVTPYAGGLRHEGIRRLAMATPVGTADARTRYLERLKAYAAFVRSQGDKLDLQAAKGIRLAQPAIEPARRLVRNLDAAADVFVPADARLVGVPDAERTAFLDAARAIIMQEIRPAYAALGGRLNVDYERAAPAAVGLMHQPGGAAVYAALAKESSGTNLTPAEIHAIGLAMMAESNAELKQVWADLGFTGSRDAFAAMIAKEPQFQATTPAGVEAHFRRAMDRIVPLLPRYFSLLPKAPYTVERAPPNIEQGMTYGYYRPPSPELPVGAYLYNGADPSARSYANAPALIYHELLPGHHFQIALQLENEGLPLLRRVNGVVPTTAYIEGWAEYAADLAGEMGLYATPYERYGRLHARLFLANRLVVDTGLNALGWSLDEARAYMKANSFASDGEIASELLRYSTDLPGQALAYSMGHRELVRMRSAAETRLGDRYSLPAFHAAVLSPGALPMDLLEGHLTRWADELAKGPAPRQAGRP
jgi:uncharacterized protein (DUF885 family)